MTFPVVRANQNQLSEVVSPHSKVARASCQEWKNDGNFKAFGAKYLSYGILLVSTPISNTTGMPRDVC